MHVASPDSTESRLNACTVGTSICSAIFLMLQHEQSPILALDDPCQVVGQQTRDYDVNGNEQQLGNIPGNVFHNAGAWPKNQEPKEHAKHHDFPLCPEPHHGGHDHQERRHDVLGARLPRRAVRLLRAHRADVEEGVQAVEIRDRQHGAPPAVVPVVGRRPRGNHHNQQRECEQAVHGILALHILT
eukprot:CAMPEP_0114251382 /NCGR_PEP_ID=MMETSP0058-20121206/15240_1 /TAXON_ID=36894 /ORGANISM="Pyramimonas parkeae, CCMP726" /LENGTH=185 /DNA_ID=CAMNT_0001365179 /DNA_START=208 /DNA_END=765 /DNA_ORIENTATION=-